jgi:hypothetical protein
MSANQREMAWATERVVTMESNSVTPWVVMWAKELEMELIQQWAHWWELVSEVEKVSWWLGNELALVLEDELVHEMEPK